MGRVWGQSPNSRRILGTVPKLSPFSPDESQVLSSPHPRSRSESGVYKFRESELATPSAPGHHDLTATLTIGFGPGHKDPLLVVSR